MINNGFIRIIGVFLTAGAIALPSSSQDADSSTIQDTTISAGSVSPPDTAALTLPRDSILVEGEIIDSIVGVFPKGGVFVLQVNALPAAVDTSGHFRIVVPQTAEYAITIASEGRLLFATTVPADPVNPDIFITCVVRTPSNKPTGDSSARIVHADTAAADGGENEIIVSAVRQQVHATATVATVKISRRELLHTAGTVNDPVRVLNTLPGVAAESDASAIPIIRGGALEEARVFLDGIPLLQPFHFGGVRSMFNTATVENLTLYKSGFPAEYHNAASGLIVVRSRSPARDSATVCGDFNLMQYNAYAGLPFLNHTLGFNAGVQGSYLDFVVKRIADIYAMSTTDSFDRRSALQSKSLINMPDYQDFSSGFEWRPSDKFSISINKLYATDKVRFTQGDSVTPQTYYYNHKLYYNDPQRGLQFYDRPTGDPAIDARLRDTSFSETFLNGEYGFNYIPAYYLSPDSIVTGRTYFKIDTTIHYRSSYNVLSSQTRFMPDPDRQLTLSMAWQRRRWDLNIPDIFYQDSRYNVNLDQWNLNAGMADFGRSSHRIKYGFQWDMTQSRFDVNTIRPLHEIISRGSTNFGDYWGPVTGDSGYVFSGNQENENTLDIAGRILVRYKGDKLFHSINAYAEDEWTPSPRSTVNYGGRVEGSTADGAVTFSPRVSIKHSLGPRNDLIGALGLYTQNNYDVSVLALSSHLRPEKAWHASTGVETNLLPWLTQKIDLFGKYYYDLASEVIKPVVPLDTLIKNGINYLRDTMMINIDSLSSADPEHYAALLENLVWGKLNYRSSYSNDGRGWAAGGEYMLRFDPTDSWNGWISLTLGKSRRQRHPGWRWHDFSFDRPVIFSIVNYYRLPRKFEVSVKFRYMSGIPYTDVQTGTNLSIGAYNAKRYSPYQSLDFRISRAYTIKKQRCHLYLEGYNILNAPNLFLNDNKTHEVKMIGLNLPFPMLFAGFDVNN